MLVIKRIVGYVMVLIIGAAVLTFGMWLTKREEQRANGIAHEYVNELGKAQR